MKMGVIYFFASFLQAQLKPNSPDCRLRFISEDDKPPAAQVADLVVPAFLGRQPPPVPRKAEGRGLPPVRRAKW